MASNPPTGRPRDDQSSLGPWKSENPWGAGSKERPGMGPGPSTGQMAGATTHQSLSAAVKARKGEYIRKRTMRVKVGSWNVASISGTEDDLGSWFVHGLGIRGLAQDIGSDDLEGSAASHANDGIESVESQEIRAAKKGPTVPRGDVPGELSDDQIDLYVLGLQEVVDVASMTEAVKPYTDPNPAKKWKRALDDALPPGYTKVAEHQLLGLLLLIYASPELSGGIGSVSTTSVGTGLMGYLGNKGAVAARLVVGETTRLCFVNCHLAAGADHAALNRRIWDTSQILSRTRFAPMDSDDEVEEEDGEKIGDEDFAFWFGDLNYRLDDVPGDDVRRLLLLHTRNEYDVENQSKRRIDTELGYATASAIESPLSQSHGDAADDPEHRVHPGLDPKDDPTSLHTTLRSLLAHDQLRNQQRLGKAFHEGWREGEIHFLPTYKYDVGSVGMFDSGEKKRSPSWCDRILFRTRHDRERYEANEMQLEASRKRDEVLKAKGIAEATAEHQVLFDYDPDTDGDVYDDDDGDGDQDLDEQADAARDATLIETHDEDENVIELISYASHQRVLSSDHKPLDAIFTLTYHAVIPELKAKVHQEVAREMDKAENEGRPAVTLVVDYTSDGPVLDTDGTVDMNLVHFGSVRYGVQKTRTITIANTGQIVARLALVEQPEASGNEDVVAPRWLRVMAAAQHGAPSMAADENGNRGINISLSPGETTTLELHIAVTDGSLVEELNRGAVDLDTVIVLRVDGGRDHFIPVKGSWLQSCFFRTLDELVQAPDGGVRAIKLEEISHGADSIAMLTAHSAPKELYSLTEAIRRYLERSIAEWSMLHDGELPPWQYDDVGIYWPFSRETWTFHEGDERSELTASVREALDTAGSLDTVFDSAVPCLVRLEVLCEVLMAFLDSIRDGIVPGNFWSEVDQQLTVMDKKAPHAGAKDIQSVLMDSLSRSPVHSVSFTFVTFLLTSVVAELVPQGPESSPPAAPSSPRFIRRSRVSDASAESAPSPTSSPHTPSRGGFLPSLPLRRRPRNSSAASSSPGVDAAVVVSDRRNKLIKAYVDVFATKAIRSDHDATLKSRDKRAMDVRKRGVLEAFLSDTP